VSSADIVSSVKTNPFSSRLKQKNPNIFQDLCLYLEVCLLLTKYSFRLSARRFIQELFMSLQLYDELYLEPYKILGIEDSPSHLSQLTEIASDETLFHSANSSSMRNKNHSAV
jgi:rapamycin-insensitive companion of mTOR